MRFSQILPQTNYDVLACVPLSNLNWLKLILQSSCMDWLLTLWFVEVGSNIPLLIFFHVFFRLTDRKRRIQMRLSRVYLKCPSSVNQINSTWSILIRRVCYFFYKYSTYILVRMCTVIFNPFYSAYTKKHRLCRKRHFRKLFCAVAY